MFDAASYIIVDYLHTQWNKYVSMIKSTKLLIRSLKVPLFLRLLK